MPRAEYRLYLDNAPADAGTLARFTEIRVDQGIGVAAEAELDLPVATDDTGAWSGVDEGFAQAFTRIRVEVKLDDAEFVPLIDGPLVGNRWRFSASPDSSSMTLVVHDDSVLLDRDERVQLFEDMAPADIVGALFAEAGLDTDIDDAPDAGAALQRVVVQRGTAMALLRQLARRYGMFAYVRPGDSPGASVGAFKRAEFAAGEWPEILLLGVDRNVANFAAEFDALRPLAPRAHAVALADRAVLAAAADAAVVAPLGDEAAHSLLPPAVTLLSGTREEQTDLDAAAVAAADLSSWAYSAQGEVDSDRYAGVLQPYKLLRVRGIGGSLAGDYLVGRVTHVLSDQSYRQRFSLLRNARSAASAAAGGTPAGVF